MSGINHSDIPMGLRTNSQIPLEWDSSVKNEGILAYLGENNQLAFTYEKGKTFFCADENTRWEWREPKFSGEQGLMPQNFVYPTGLTPVNEINYSGLAYNFFPYNVANTVNYQLLVDSLNITLGWKKGKPSATKTKEQLPKGITNYPDASQAIFKRTGYIGYLDPKVSDNELVYDDYVQGVDTYVAKVIEADILNLIVDIADFDKIKNYQPKLVFSRYTPSRIKHTNHPKEKAPGVYFPERTIKTGKYRISKAENPARPNYLPLSVPYNVVDFGQEHYFSIDSKYIMNPDNENPIITPRGIGKKNFNFNKNKVTERNYLEYYTYLYMETQIEITVSGIKYLSVPLSRFKMQCCIKFQSASDLGNFRTEIRYKHV